MWVVPKKTNFKKNFRYLIRNQEKAVTEKTDKEVKKDEKQVKSEQKAAQIEQAAVAVEKVNSALSTTASKLTEQLDSRLGETNKLLFLALILMAGVALVENLKLALIPAIIIGLRFVPELLKKSIKK